MVRTYRELNTGEFWMRALAVFLLLGSSMLAFAQEAEFPSESLNKQFAQAVNNGDAAALASFYTDDAYVFPPGAPIVRGRAEIEKLWAGVTQQFGNVSLSTLEVKMLGDRNALEIGTVIGTTKGAEQQSVTGKYVVLWRRVGSDWEMETDI
jgi:uncharacterized protein (TIGR02246 family)